MNKKLTKKDLEQQIIDLADKWKRALADYANLEKRVQQERQDFIKFSSAGLIDKLLGVLDDLERAEKHLKNKGLTMAVNQFKSVLKTEGVEEIIALGNRFDPNSMDCVEMVKGKKNIVSEVVLKGYLLNNKILRPVKVKVGKGD